MIATFKAEDCIICDNPPLLLFCELLSLVEKKMPVQLTLTLTLMMNCYLYLDNNTKFFSLKRLTVILIVIILLHPSFFVVYKVIRVSVLLSILFSSFHLLCRRVPICFSSNTTKWNLIKLQSLLHISIVHLLF